MSKKRKREAEPSMLALASIYEKLADEGEEQRLSAAQALLTEFAPKSTSIEQIKVIITRLFRGLCSSRKAARLGFSVALTEYLVEVNVQRGASFDIGVPASTVIDILDNETTPEGNNSGQDERDHYFGRLFGAEAIIKSNILTKQQNLLQWKRLLDLICGIANKKPWLKQECGWILYNGIESFVSNELSVPDDFALIIVEKLTSHKLIRTPEGLAIWLEVKEVFPDARFPKDIWRHGDPLSKKDITLLTDVLKDAKPRSNSDGDEHKSQGRAIWSAQLHFAWNVVLARLFKPTPTEDGEKGYKTIDFGMFWSKAVEESLFAATSSSERKHWGLLLLSKVLTESPDFQSKTIFTKNATSCLLNALKGEDRYLQRTAQKVLQSLHKRVESDPGAAEYLLADLIRGTNYIDFDKLTKTKTVEKLLGIGNADAQAGMADTLSSMFHMTNALEVEEAEAQRRQLIQFQSRLLNLWMSDPENIERSSSTPKGIPRPGRPVDALPPVRILKNWIGVAYFPSSPDELDLTDATRGLVKARLSAHFEQALKAGAWGTDMICTAIGDIRLREQVGELAVISFEPAMKSILNQGWTRFDSLVENSDHDNLSVDLDGGNNTFKHGLLLLYCLTIFQIYDGDAEAVEILEDLLSYDKHTDLRTKAAKSHQREDQSDALVEILLNFASKPSKFMRRIINLIFEGIAPRITSKGLESLTRILATKESLQGQEEMFDVADEDADDQEEEDSADSDADMRDSDVDVMSVSSSLGADSDENLDEEEASNTSEKDAELAEFDAKLAAALGTQKFVPGTSSPSSSTSGDTDMDDAQMIALDAKLVEVFRARRDESSKKRTAKDARENIVNFKNRVLDLIEIYLKVEYLTSQSLTLLVPLLELARKSKTKQLADRACTVVNDFCKRCKGANVPLCSNDEAGLSLLRALHAEAASGASNAHANAASHASILVVKSLANGSSDAGVNLLKVVDVYATTQKRMLSEKKWKVQAGLFTDWNNWCVSARERFAE